MFLFSLNLNMTSTTQMVENNSQIENRHNAEITKSNPPHHHYAPIINPRPHAWSWSTSPGPLHHPLLNDTNVPGFGTSRGVSSGWVYCLMRKGGRRPR